MSNREDAIFKESACPFCGITNLQGIFDVFAGANSYSSCVVICLECDAQGPPGDTAQIARDGWKRRWSAGASRRKSETFYSALRGNPQGLNGASCPFCGGTDITMFGDDGKHWTICESCLAHGPSEVTESAAITKWKCRNSR